MIISDAFEKQKAKESERRARVVVLGEFSAGKSTLINLLTAGQKLRTQVTATQMPAVWMSWGMSAPFRVDLKGNQHPINLDDLSTVSVKDTAYIRMFMKTPVLEMCDLIDTPGNSDPNIPASAWERVAEIADVAVWLSPCTQAWRQSELAAWSEVPERVREKSILMLTRADKITTDEDREKVFKRVTREAGDLFSKIHMGSLLQFSDLHEFLRDLIALCKTVEATDPPRIALTDDVLDAMGNASGEAVVATDPAIDAPSEPVVAAAEPNEVDEADEDENLILAELLETEEDSNVADQALEALAAPFIPETDKRSEPQQTSRKQFATALWDELTEGMTASDPETVDAVFQVFLTRLDHEVSTLRELVDLKMAG